MLIGPLVEERALGRAEGFTNKSHVLSGKQRGSLSPANHDALK